MDYLQVALKLSSQDVVSGLSKLVGCVAEILLLLLHHLLHSHRHPHTLRLGHLGKNTYTVY